MQRKLPAYDKELTKSSKVLCPIWYHYSDVIMGALASQITSLTIVYSIVYSDVDQRKHQSPASLAFVRGIHRGPVNSPHKWSVTRKMFLFDDVIMQWWIQHGTGIHKTLSVAWDFKLITGYINKASKLKYILRHFHSGGIIYQNLIISTNEQWVDKLHLLDGRLLLTLSPYLAIISGALLRRAIASTPPFLDCWTSTSNSLTLCYMCYVLHIHIFNNVILNILAEIRYLFRSWFAHQ